MVMMTFLAQTNFIFKTQKLLAVFAKLAVHVVYPISDFFNPLRKCIQNQ
ncbi:uncharacterized protein METZ01_LOCUS322997, partial [marine metagenome]